MVTPLTVYDTPLRRRPVRERAFEENKDRIWVLRRAYPTDGAHLKHIVPMVNFALRDCVWSYSRDISGLPAMT